MEKFYFTFKQKNNYSIVHAKSMHEAKKIANECYGPNWDLCYDYGQWVFMCNSGEFKNYELYDEVNI